LFLKWRQKLCFTINSRFLGEKRTKTYKDRAKSTPTHTSPRRAHRATLSIHRSYTNAKLELAYAKKMAPQEEADGFDFDDRPRRRDAQDLS
jgi:hypothetical protein